MSRPDLALEEIVALVRATRLRDEAARTLRELEYKEQIVLVTQIEAENRRRTRNPRRFRAWSAT